MKKNLAIAGVDLPDGAKKYLTERFDTVLLPRDKLLAAPVSSHADMILTIFDKKLFCHNTYYNENKSVIDYICEKGGLALSVSDCPRGPKYPSDVAFNVLSLTDRIICRKDCVAPTLASYPVVDTKQGYAGCTALWAADTVITADPSTLKACENAHIPFHRISGEDISLSGYGTGFIGGACGVFGNTVYICGDYTQSRSGMELFDFCKNKNLRLVSICDGPVTDIGGIKFV